MLTPTSRVLWIMYGVAALSFIPHLFLQYVGEEGVYTVVAQEMWVARDYIVPTLYGIPYSRPGLYSWLTLPLVSLLGWENVLISTRLITAAATVLTGLSLAWLIRRLFKNTLLAVCGALIFLSGDVLMYRGWLAYSDPCYMLFAFSAMACLWIATEERRNGFLGIAGFLLVAAVLTKTLTVYAHYGALAVVLLWRHENRRFLLNPQSLAIHAAMLAFPFAWQWAFPRDPLIAWFSAQTSDELFLGRHAESALSAANLLLFPLRLVWLLLPISVIALYCLTRSAVRQSVLSNSHFMIAGWTALVGVLPYWISGASPRHLMPLYPFMALLMIIIVSHAGEAVKQLSLVALAVTIGIAHAASVAGFPLYERYFRGDYREMAKQVLRRAGDAPVYSTDRSAFGLSVVANINSLRGPGMLVTTPSGRAPGFVLADKPNAAYGSAVLTLQSGHRMRYLLCPKTLCPAEAREIS